MWCQLWPMSPDLASPQGRAHSGLGLAWSDSGGTGAKRPSGPAADHQSPRAEGCFGQRMCGAVREALLQEAGPERGAGQGHRLLSLLLQGCQGHHCRYHCRRHLCLRQRWVTLSQTHHTTAHPHTHTHTHSHRHPALTSIPWKWKLKILRWLFHLTGRAQNIHYEECQSFFYFFEGNRVLCPSPMKIKLLAFTMLLISNPEFSLLLINPYMYSS